MRASSIEFRLRMIIQIVIVFMGFWAPWICRSLDLGRRISTLEWLALRSAAPASSASPMRHPSSSLLGALAAATGAVFRVWGAACLGYAPSTTARCRPAR